MLVLSTAPAMAVGAIEVGVLLFRVPDAWVQIPAAGHRVAAFEVPTEHGSAIVTFDRIPDASASAVTASWAELFEEAPEDIVQKSWTERIADCPVHFARLYGAWRGGDGIGPGKVSMATALFESRRGLVLVRLLGQPDAVEAAAGTFLSVVKRGEDGWKP